MDCGLFARWVALALVAVALIVPAFARSNNGAERTATTMRAARASHPALFYDEASFFEAVAAADTVPAPVGPVAGGIIPHHLLPGYLIAGFFRGLAAGEAPSTVILIGPNHDNEGRARALTSELVWETPFGTLEPDLETIHALTGDGLVAVEDAVLTTEHSVAGIMPAIKYYLPEARVAPIILSGDVTPAEARRLGEALAARSRASTVVVAAVDFSHDLVRAQAERHDAVTIEALRRGNAGALFTLDNRYLDSPPSIATLMATMVAQGSNDFVLVENTNSGALLDDQLAPTTSYVLGYFGQGIAATDLGGRSGR